MQAWNEEHCGVLSYWSVPITTSQYDSTETTTWQIGNGLLPFHTNNNQPIKLLGRPTFGEQSLQFACCSHDVASSKA